MSSWQEDDGAADNLQFRDAMKKKKKVAPLKKKREGDAGADSNLQLMKEAAPPKKKNGGKDAVSKETVAYDRRNMMSELFPVHCC